MTITTTNYLDIFNFVANELLGSTLLFVVLGSIAIIYFSMKVRLQYEHSLMLMVIWIGLVFDKTRIIVIWAALLLVVSFSIYYSYNKFIKR